MLSSLKTGSSIAEISNVGGCDRCIKIASENWLKMTQSYCFPKAGIAASTAPAGDHRGTSEIEIHFLKRLDVSLLERNCSLIR